MVVMMRKAITPCGVLQERPPGYPSNIAVGGNGTGKKLLAREAPPVQDSAQRPAKLLRTAAAPGFPAPTPKVSSVAPARTLAAAPTDMPPPRAPSTSVPSEIAAVSKSPRSAGVQPGLQAVERAMTSATSALDTPMLRRAVSGSESDAAMLRQLTFSERDKADLEQWVDSPNVGRVVPFTCIVPCKTPIEGNLAARSQEAGIIPGNCQFTRDTLLATARAAGTPIGLVIDLVSTRKYYQGFEQSDGVEYIKIPVPAKVVPPTNIIEAVLDAIDEFISRRPSPNLHVALHCTHGVNRTGFFVGAYLLLRTKEGAELGHIGAIETFNIARGCNMDKELFVDALKELASKGLRSFS
mmetsp:Transcript_126820/g.224685  ORF Transcript_126820/g.224685 Transcript_126820/m.224685 type:complete len:353 (-) Transcript_126820:44-1102(-)